MSRFRRAVLAAILAPAALAVSPVAAEEPPPAPPAPPVEAPKPAFAETPEALEAMTAEVMKDVERVRGLAFKAPVKRVWKSRDEARAEMLSEIEKTSTPEELKAQSRAFAFFGFLKEGQMLQDVFADFIGAGAGGYYIPDQKTFSLIRGFDAEGSRPIVFHELVHALEDQYFDFDPRTKVLEKERRDDENMALHALVEGSARTFENRYVAESPERAKAYMKAQLRESMKQMKVMFKLPAVLVIIMGMFPYENGSEFLAAVLPALQEGTEGGEGAALAGLFADPPLSTEQILHPEKYLGDRDLPQRVVLGDLATALGEGWTELLQGTQGELLTALALNAWLHPPGLLPQVGVAVRPPTPDRPNAQVIEFKGDTAVAAAGWDGDRFAVMGTADAACLGWVSTWDSPEDAAEFAALYVRALEKKYKGAARTDAPAPSGGFGSVRLTPAEGTTATEVRLSGSRVVIAERVPSPRLAAVLAALEASTITPDPKDSLPAR